MEYPKVPLITGKKRILKAFAQECEEELGFKILWKHFDLDNTGIVLKLNITGYSKTEPTSLEDWKVLCPTNHPYFDKDDIICKFNLPIDWERAIDFLKEQIKHPYFTEKDFKIGKWIKIIERPKVWSSKLINNNPLSLEYPFAGKIIDSVDSEREGVFKILNISKYGFVVMENDNDISNFKVLTEDEVKTLLIEEAHKRGFIDGFELKLINKSVYNDCPIYHGTIDDKYWIYNSKDDSLSCIGVTIYKDGKWAKYQSVREEKKSEIKDDKDKEFFEMLHLLRLILNREI